MTAEMILTDNKQLKNELTTRLEKLQKVYQNFIKGDPITRIVKVVEEEVQSVSSSLGMSDKDKAILLDKVKSKILAQVREDKSSEGDS